MFGDIVIYNAARNHKALVADYIVENRWKWPAAITWELLYNRNATLPHIRQDTLDVVWIPNQSSFSIGSAYDEIAPRQPTVFWHNIMWNKVNIVHLFYG